jgi:hypothetical protein
MGYRLSRFRIIDGIAMNLSKLVAVGVKYTTGLIVGNEKPIDSDHAENLREGELDI